jgi:hypothetical protein
MATGGGGGGGGVSTTTLPTVTGHTVVEVTVPRRNGKVVSTIKSETYDPRSSTY